MEYTPFNPCVEVACYVKIVRGNEPLSPIRYAGRILDPYSPRGILVEYEVPSRGPVPTYQSGFFRASDLERRLVPTHFERRVLRREMASAL